MYTINGTQIPYPQSGKWKERNSLGVTGNGNPIYPRIRQFELRWSYLAPSEFSSIRNLFLALGNTGTATVSLPQYGGSTYNFTYYSGCTLQEPQVGEFFEEHYSDVILVVNKVMA